MSIFFTNIKVELHTRGKRWGDFHQINGVVFSEIDDRLKRKLIIKIKGEAKGSKFDLDRIRITNIEKLFELGLGYTNQIK